MLLERQQTPFRPQEIEKREFTIVTQTATVIVEIAKPTAEWFLRELSDAKSAGSETFPQKVKNLAAFFQRMEIPVNKDVAEEILSAKKEVRRALSDWINEWTADVIAKENEKEAMRANFSPSGIDTWYEKPKLGMPVSPRPLPISTKRPVPATIHINTGSPASPKKSPAKKKPIVVPQTPSSAAEEADIINVEETLPFKKQMNGATIIEDELLEEIAEAEDAAENPEPSIEEKRQERGDGKKRRKRQEALRSPVENYLLQINELPLLTAAQEKILARALGKEKEESPADAVRKLQEGEFQEKMRVVRQLAETVLEVKNDTKPEESDLSVSDAVRYIRTLAHTVGNDIISFTQAENGLSPEDTLLEDAASLADPKNLVRLERKLVTTRDKVDLIAAIGKAARIIRGARDAFDLGKDAGDDAGEMQDYLREMDSLGIDVRNISPKDILIRSNLRLAVNIARAYMGKGLSFQDLIEEGNLGLIRATEGFDPTMNTRFSTYASYWIKQTIKVAIVNQSKTVRIPAYMVELLSKWRRAKNTMRSELGYEPSMEDVAARLQLPKKKLDLITETLQLQEKQRLSLSADENEEYFVSNEILTDKNAEDPAEIFEEQQDTVDMLLMLETMDPREADVLRSRFGLDNKEPQTLKEIGERLGLTRERVRQIESEALEKLGDRMDERKNITTRPVMRKPESNGHASFPPLPIRTKQTTILFTGHIPAAAPVAPKTETPIEDVHSEPPPLIHETEAVAAEPNEAIAIVKAPAKETPLRQKATPKVRVVPARTAAKNGNSHNDFPIELLLEKIPSIRKLAAQVGGMHALKDLVDAIMPE